jgi:hypothetical protein
MIPDWCAGFASRRQMIGSYPRFDGERYSVQIVIRGHDQAAINNTRKTIEAMLAALIGK